MKKEGKCINISSNTVYRKEVKMLPSICDASGQLSIDACFDLFMDIATEHQEMVDSGVLDLARQDKYWIATKTRIVLNERPHLLESVSLNTWFEKPNHLCHNRDYSIEQDGKVLVSGVTQWMVIDGNTGRPCNMKDVYPEYVIFSEDLEMTKPFINIPKNLQWSYAGDHLVQYSDIDMAKHMNNVAYIRAIQNLFSVENWEKLNIQTVEIHYKKPCVEGDQIKFFLYTENDTMYIKAENNGEIAIESLIRSSGMI